MVVGERIKIVHTKGFVHSAPEPVVLEESLLSSKSPSLDLSKSKSVVPRMSLPQGLKKSAGKEIACVGDLPVTHCSVVRRLSVHEGHVVRLGRDVYESLLQVVEAVGALLLQKHLNGAADNLMLALCGV